MQGGIELFLLTWPASAIVGAVIAGMLGKLLGSKLGWALDAMVGAIGTVIVVWIIAALTPRNGLLHSYAGFPGADLADYLLNGAIGALVALVIAQAIKKQPGSKPHDQNPPRPAQ